MSPLAKCKLALLTVGLLIFAPAIWAGSSTFTSINYPDAVATAAYGINPAGDIVGAYDDSSGNEHGFLLHAGVYTSFDFPGATWTDAYAITPQGDIIGQYGKADNTSQGFLLRKGNFYPIEVAGPTDSGYANTMPFGLSPDGRIAGCYHQSTPEGYVIGSTMHGFELDANGVTFDTVAGSMHTGINPQGDLTGYAMNGQSYVITAERSTTWFVVSGALVTRAQGISATGDVVGWYKDASGKFRGFLRHEGETTSINVPFSGVTQTRAWNINAAGDIVGYYIDATGYHGFLLSRRGGD